jgi:hypothetical protein
MRTFIKYFLLTGGAHLALALPLFLIIHLLFPYYQLNWAVAASIGGACGSGLVTGLYAAWYEKNI